MRMGHAGGILMQSNIAAVREASFDLPVFSSIGQEPMGIGLGTCQARQTIVDELFFSYDLSLTEKGESAFQAKGLASKGPMQFAGQQAASSQGAFLDPAMPFIDRMGRLEVPTRWGNGRTGKEQFQRVPKAGLIALDRPQVIAPAGHDLLRKGL